MTNHRTLARRLRRAVAALGVAGAVSLLAPAAPAAADALSLDLLNERRAAHGLGPVWQDEVLRQKAQAWADRLAAERTLYHSVLDAYVPAGWRWLAENVGSGANHYDVQGALNASPPHAANMLHVGAGPVGTGATVGADGRLYLVQVFGAW